MAYIGIGVALVAVIISGLSVLYAHQSAREARRANTFPAVLDLLREYRSTLEPSRRYVIRDLANEVPDTTFGVSELPPSAREHVLAVCRYLDHLGIVVDQGLADPDAVAGYMKESIIRLWERLSPYIRAERIARSQGYAEYFEDLAVRMADTDATKIRGHLRKWPLDSAAVATGPRDPNATP